jgi:hypothetical protein
MEGARTYLITTGMVLLLVRHYIIKPIKLRWLIVFGISAMITFSSIKIVRNVAAFDIGKMQEELQYAHQAQATKWYDSLVEMGGSVETVNLVAMLMPENYPYWHGRSYMQALIHIIPFAQSRAELYIGMGPAVWLTVTQFGRDSAGTGFSIAAEGYLNFGMPGVVMQMMLIGIVLRWLYYRFVWSMSIVNALVFIVAFGIFMVSVRNHTNIIFSPMARIIVIALALKIFCGERQVYVGQADEGSSNSIERQMPNNGTEN